MSNTNEARSQHNEETLAYATSHKQPWGSEEEATILEYNHRGGTLEAAYLLGRSLEAVQYHRYILKLRLQKQQAHTNLKATINYLKGNTPLTLQEALKERTKQLATGIEAPTIRQVPGGWEVVQGVFLRGCK